MLVTTARAPASGKTSVTHGPSSSGDRAAVLDSLFSSGQGFESVLASAAQAVRGHAEPARSPGQERPCTCEPVAAEAAERQDEADGVRVVVEEFTAWWMFQAVQVSAAAVPAGETSVAGVQAEGFLGARMDLLQSSSAETAACPVDVSTMSQGAGASAQGAFPEEAQAAPTLLSPPTPSPANQTEINGVASATAGLEEGSPATRPTLFSGSATNAQQTVTAGQASSAALAQNKLGTHLRLQGTPSAADHGYAQPGNVESALKTILAGPRVNPNGDDLDRAQGLSGSSQSSVEEEPEWRRSRNDASPLTLGLDTTRPPAPAPRPQEVREPRPVVEQLVEQIVTRMEMVRREGRTEVHLRLDPPNLGTVSVQLSFSENRLTARLIAGEEATRQLLESQLGTLRVRMGDAGVALGGFDVARQGTGSQEQWGRRPSRPDSGGGIPDLERTPDAAHWPSPARGDLGMIDLVA